MNKRARLMRRILRDHRQLGAGLHVTRVYGKRGGAEVYDLFSCPRCPRYGLISTEIPHAYR